MTIQELKEQLSNYYDLDALETDYNNNNFSLDNWEDNIQNYYMPEIVYTSICNGQMKQAKQQFQSYGISITDLPKNLTRNQIECLTES